MHGISTSCCRCTGGGCHSGGGRGAQLGGGCPHQLWQDCHLHRGGQASRQPGRCGFGNRAQRCRQQCHPSLPLLPPTPVLPPSPSPPQADHMCSYAAAASTTRPCMHLARRGMLRANPEAKIVVVVPTLSLAAQQATAFTTMRGSPAFQLAEHKPHARGEHQ